MDVFKAELRSNSRDVPAPAIVKSEWIITENGRWWLGIAVTFGDDETLCRNVARGLNAACARCFNEGKRQVQDVIREALDMPAVSL